MFIIFAPSYLDLFKFHPCGTIILYHATWIGLLLYKYTTLFSCFKTVFSQYFNFYGVFLTFLIDEYLYNCYILDKSSAVR